MFSGFFSSSQYNFARDQWERDLSHILHGGVAAAEATIFARLSIFDEAQFLPRHQSSSARSQEIFRHSGNGMLHLILL